LTTRGNPTSRADVQSRDSARRQLAEAPVELVERDGRVWQLRRLAGGERVDVDEPAPVTPRRPPRAVAIA
jgi:hypothetical protein